MVTPVGKREAVTHLREEFEVSERRACLTLNVDRSMVRYQSVRPMDDPIRTRLRELSVERKRFGYRRLHILLAREGYHINHKKLRRLYKEEGLAVRKRSGRKRAIGTRAPIAVPSKINERWSLDFVNDSFMDGRRFRMLCVVDDHSRECLALVADTSIGGHRLARELDQIIFERGKPHTIVSDNGSEMTSNIMQNGRKIPKLTGIILPQASRCKMDLWKVLMASYVMSALTKPCLKTFIMCGMFLLIGAMITITSAPTHH